MELSQLEYFLTAAKLEHFTKAAEALHITQPALSRSIARLEADVGARLFDRRGSRVRLSRQGEIFLRRAERAMAELTDGLTEIADLNDSEGGRIAISTSTTGFLSKPLVNYLAAHPKTHLIHLIEDAAQMAASLEAGETDFAISLLPIEKEGLVWTPLVSEEILAFVCETHPLAQRGTVCLRDLAEERFIFNSSSFGMRDGICAYCRGQGFEPNIFYEGGEDDMIVPLVEQNLGVLFVTSMAHFWRRSELPITPVHPLALLRISDPIGTRTIGTVRLRNHYLSPAARSLLDYLTSYFQTQGSDEHGE